MILQSLLFTVICVSFAQPKYLAEEADGVMNITVQPSVIVLTAYDIMIEPIEDLPVGGPGSYAAIQCI